MRFTAIYVFAFALLLSVSAQADDFYDLKHSIRGYKNLMNTPSAPLTEFTHADGSTVTLADFKGKVVLLNLWATWCPPCIKEMPGLNELAKELKNEDFVVIAVATGRQGRETPDEFLKKRELTDMLSYHDKGQDFLRKMDINSLPVSFIIDPEGVMRGGVKGRTEWDAPKAKEALKKLLDNLKKS
jgi:thiol-disulfide isomerase/thioredoxin